MFLAHLTDSILHNAFDLGFNPATFLGGAFILNIILTILKKLNLMPCDTITTVQVELGKMNADLLFSALKEMDLNPTRMINGMILFGDGEWHDPSKGETMLQTWRDASEIKRAYSAEIIKSQAKKYGWQLKQTGKYEFAVTKR